jgi:uncharacterized damage-inducible protein DinB
MKYFSMLLVAGLFGAATSQAQVSQLITELKQNYNGQKNTLTRAAAEMPEADYSFKATPAIRTYGEMVVHVAEVQMALCGMASGEQKRISNPKATSKADVEADLKEAFEACDPVYEGLTDKDATEMAKFFGGRERSKFGILDFAVMHDNEMYGQMVIYLRLKGLVPPSSQGRGMRGGKKE